MSLKEQINGLQHIGVPARNMEETITFYEKLGFETAFETVNDGNRVVFLKFASLVIETYESRDTAMKSGAIDHIALDVKDIEKTYELINQEGLNTTKDPIHFLPFWENGVKFFTIEGPNLSLIHI